MIVAVTLNPSFDKALTVPELRPGSLHRVRLGPVVPSGKGINVARVVHAWGHPVTALALAGEGRDALASFLDGCGVPHHLVPIPGAIRTNIKLFEQEHGRMTELNEPGPAVDEGALAVLEAHLLELCRSASAVVFAGSLPQGAPSCLYARLATAVAGTGVLTVVDSSGAALRHALAAPLSLIKPNRCEAEELFAQAGVRPGQTERELMDSLLATGVSHVILTLGAKGALFAHGGEIIRAIPPKIRSGNAAGAGDALLATYLVGTLEGWPIAERVARATAAGAAAARTLGTDLATPQEVAELLPGVQLIRRV